MAFTQLKTATTVLMMSKERRQRRQRGLGETPPRELVADAQGE